MRSCDGILTGETRGEMYPGIEVLVKPVQLFKVVTSV